MIAWRYDLLDAEGRLWSPCDRRDDAQPWPIGGARRAECWCAAMGHRSILPHDVPGVGPYGCGLHAVTRLDELLDFLAFPPPRTEHPSSPLRNFPSLSRGRALEAAIDYMIDTVRCFGVIGPVELVEPVLPSIYSSDPPTAVRAAGVRRVGPLYVPAWRGPETRHVPTRYGINVQRMPCVSPDDWEAAFLPAIRRHAR